MSRCSHKNFVAQVNVDMIIDVGKFVASITIKCRECGLPFRFVGVNAGHSYNHPMVSVDSTELRAPIEPELNKKVSLNPTYEIRKTGDTR